MKRYLFVVVFGIMLTGQFNLGLAAVVFSDDFNIDGLDASKWTPLTDPGCSLTVAGGALHNYFDGYGSSYAKSVNIPLPLNWESVTVTGQWAYPVVISGELLMSIRDADAPENWDNVAYDTYNGLFRAQDSVSAPSNFLTTPRSPSPSLTDFEWTITPTGWQFQEYRDGNWTLLVDRSNTNLAEMSQMFLMIGGWEYSHYESLQETNYDNIAVTVVPEPATIAMLGLGSLVLFKKRKA